MNEKQESFFMLKQTREKNVQTYGKIENHQFHSMHIFQYFFFTFNHYCEIQLNKEHHQSFQSRKSVVSIAIIHQKQKLKKVNINKKLKNNII